MRCILFVIGLYCWACYIVLDHIDIGLCFGSAHFLDFGGGCYVHHVEGQISWKKGVFGKLYLRALDPMVEFKNLL